MAPDLERLARMPWPVASLASSLAALLPPEDGGGRPHLRP